MELREHFDLAILRAELDRLMGNLEARSRDMANHDHRREECLIVIGRIQGHMDMLRRLAKMTRPNMDELRLASDITNNAIQMMRLLAMPRS
jgi:hypothetical protein